MMFEILTGIPTNTILKLYRFEPNFSVILIKVQLREDDRFVPRFSFLCIYCYIKPCRCIQCGPGSSVGIATDYGLVFPGSNPNGDEIFRPSRPGLGPTQTPVKRVPGLSPG